MTGLRTNLWINVEGVKGIGKTTLVEYLAKRLYHPLVLKEFSQEELDSWPEDEVLSNIKERRTKLWIEHEYTQKDKICDRNYLSTVVYQFKDRYVDGLDLMGEWYYGKALRGFTVYQNIINIVLYFKWRIPSRCLLRGIAPSKLREDNRAFRSLIRTRHSMINDRNSIATIGVEVFEDTTAEDIVCKLLRRSFIEPSVY